MDNLDRKARDAESKHRHYLANKERYTAQARAKKIELRDMVTALKSNPCTDCKTSYPPYIMHYDHIADNKVMSVSDLINNCNKQAVLDEIDKCELVCANCHGIRTYRRLKNKYAPIV